ncbi:MAG TPA: PilZ domain-containing protein [Candidatus Omnitrophota bacterium]|nr:PilZ domain-containing protein [Candidatus Omnitrophota bacterium]
MQQLQERRKHPRVNRSIPLKISSGDFDIVTETENISGAGAYCRSDRYIEPMTKLKVVILLPTKQRNKIATRKVECTGVVVRSENVPSDHNLFKIAIFFTDISSKDTQKISEYIHQHLNKVSVTS